MLALRSSRFRGVHDLSGWWRIKADPRKVGHREEWFTRPLPADAEVIAVPGAWNEQLAERGWMNYVGRAWYETEVSLPPLREPSRRVWLRIEAADHRADVWVNGRAAGGHEGGFLPFELELSGLWNHDGPNRITVCVDSTLTFHTLPQGLDPAGVPYDQPSYERRHHFPPARFDFFPYGGLTRGVAIVTTPRDRIRVVRVNARVEGSVTVSVGVDGAARSVRFQVLDPAGAPASGPAEVTPEGTMATAELRLSRAWSWSPSTPVLYTLRAELLDGEGRRIDQVEELFGFRTVAVDGSTLLLNGEPLYLVGFGKHEEYPVVGRGRFLAGYRRDLELMRWAGANSFRTSHYPYDEEILNLADRLGLLVIDEVPAVSLGFDSDRYEDLLPLLETHKRALTELIARDANHPSVIAWSIVNEPNLWTEPHYQHDTGRRYFRDVYEHAHSLDSSRPVVAITMSRFGAQDIALEACDIIGINRYYGWYTDPADLELAGRKLDAELEEIHAAHRKPILVTEFGADSVEGYHATTAQLFTEEYQSALLRVYGDVIASKPYCAGEHVWNFADFRTPQNHRRVVLNRKGVFTRSREPKGAAFEIRERWRSLGRVAASHRPSSPQTGHLVEDIR